MARLPMLMRGCHGGGESGYSVEAGGPFGGVRFRMGCLRARVGDCMFVPLGAGPKFLVGR